ncbi:DNA polymerase-3 subunit delta' [Cerasibacillus quisquiliarum]|uniref:DNA polymerase III subunit delta n=1 Tax=Cerasibacillus quisquiliarum TaxID=227865 RepID=A0A511UZV7_9BACI|nr:DNA polymerase III subunit delta' [Cerasibacillus quisquiliarum]MBB5146559.1 DNA polymerase-3 subunit delta' [Cerasibacillus quisquiliarum]GEN31258.1 DNA polymerase III subunit delta' [Cerasibacillus quisquiliarum]
METWSKALEKQPLVSKILMNSIKRDRLSHAYLFQGSRGTGKESLAILLAKTLFCKEKTDVEPCHHCVMCKRIESRNHPDVHWIEPDGQSIKMAQIEHLQKEFAYTGLESNRKVYMIKDADTLTVNAANRILKFLEEPSLETTAIMLTENSQMIIPTIRSRCQVLDFKPLDPKQFQTHLLKEGLPKSDAVLMGSLTNSVKEAIELYQDESFVQARKLVIQLIEMFCRDSDDAYLFVHQHWVPFFKERSQQEQALDLLLLAFRDILYAHIGINQVVFFDQDDQQLEKYMLHFSYGQVISMLENILEAKRKLKQYVQPTFVMEQLALQI